jgi:hypothetical protein
MSLRKARCSICNGVLHGYGRSAQPVSDGLCCTQCNHAYVIPARLARLQAHDAKPLRAVAARDAQAGWGVRVRMWRPFEPLRTGAQGDARLRTRPSV